MISAPGRDLAELRVEEVNDRAAFAALAPEWDALVAVTRDEIFLRHSFLRVWIDNFAPRARLRVLLARDGSGALRAALPLMEERTFLYGVPVRQLVATANAHSCRFDLIAQDAVAASAAFFSHLRSDPGWDVLRLTDVPEDGKGWALYREAERAGLPVGAWRSLDSPYIPLPGRMEDLLARLDAKFKANCRRRRKKLEEKGEVTFERITGGERLDARLEEGLQLEQSGWKGERGTAIRQDKATAGFYSELARQAAYDGALALSFLRLDGRPIAFHFALQHRGAYSLLKPGYDEGLRECSPGQLLMERVLADCIERGLTELDFLGPEMTWKRDWTDAVRAHDWLFIFRDSRLGRALRSAKFRWVPAAKEVMAAWKR